MSNSIVLSVSVSGVVESVHSDSFDLGFLGQKQVVRQCIIEFDAMEQTWAVVYLSADGARTDTPIKGIDRYEEATKLEAAWLNDCRLLNVCPTSEEGIDTARFIMAMRNSPG